MSGQRQPEEESRRNTEGYAASLATWSYCLQIWGKKKCTYIYQKTRGDPSSEHRETLTLLWTFPWSVLNFSLICPDRSLSVCCLQSYMSITCHNRKCTEGKFHITQTPLSLDQGPTEHFTYKQPCHQGCLVAREHQDQSLFSSFPLVLSWNMQRFFNPDQ